MPLASLGGALGSLGSLFGGGSQSTANNAFQSTLSVTPIISIGGSVGAETLSSGSSDAQADPTFSQSGAPSALGGVLGSSSVPIGSSSVVSGDLSALVQPSGSFITNPFILGGIGLIGAGIFFFGGK